MNSPFSSESLSRYSRLSLNASYVTPSFGIYKWTGKGQFEEAQHDHDVSANVLILTYQKIIKFLQRAKKY